MSDTETNQKNRCTAEAVSTETPDERSRDGERPPEPDGLPLLGNTIDFLRGGLEFAERLQKHGDVVRYTALGEEFVVVSDPQLIESVLVSRNDEFWKGSFENELAELLAPNGLVFTDGEQWRDQRSLLQPLFTPERLQSYTESIQTAADAAASEWPAQETIDLRAACSKLTLSILADTLFTIDLTTDRGEIVREAVSAIRDRTDVTNITYVWPEWAPRTPTQRRFDRVMADFDELIEELIRERRQTHTDHDDLLAALLGADDSVMDTETVRDQLPAYTVHRDSRWWNEPDAFVPDRWTGTTNRPEYAYFPFGGGPRHCIGMRFAMTELKIALTTLLQRLDVERVTESFTLSPNALLDPGKVMMRVHERA